MNCPNCDQRPVGAFHSFRISQLNLNSNCEYFDCRHCGTKLKQEKNNYFLPKYRKIFWVYYFLIMAAILASVWGLFSILEQSDFGIWVWGTLFVLIVAGMVGIIDELKARYWIIEEVDPDMIEATPSNKLSGKGLVLFLVFSVASILLIIAVHYYLNLEMYGELIYFSGIFIYIAAVMFGAVYILNKYSEKRVEGVTKDD